jgi:hypothetical protein
LLAGTAKSEGQLRGIINSEDGFGKPSSCSQVARPDPEPPVDASRLLARIQSFALDAAARLLRNTCPQAIQIQVENSSAWRPSSIFGKRHCGPLVPALTADSVRRMLI